MQLALLLCVFSVPILFAGSLSCQLFRPLQGDGDYMKWMNAAVKVMVTCGSMYSVAEFSANGLPGAVFLQTFLSIILWFHAFYLGACFDLSVTFQAAAFAFALMAATDSTFAILVAVKFRRQSREETPNHLYSLPFFTPMLWACLALAGAVFALITGFTEYLHSENVPRLTLCLEMVDFSALSAVLVTCPFMATWIIAWWAKGVSLKHLQGLRAAQIYLYVGYCIGVLSTSVQLVVMVFVYPDASVSDDQKVNTIVGVLSALSYAVAAIGFDITIHRIQKAQTVAPDSSREMITPGNVGPPTYQESIMYKQTNYPPTQPTEATALVKN